LGKVHLWLTFVRFHLTFPVPHWVGAKGMPRRLRRLPAHRRVHHAQHDLVDRGVALGASTLTFIWNVFHSYGAGGHGGRPVGLRRLTGVGPRAARRRGTTSPSCRGSRDHAMAIARYCRWGKNLRKSRARVAGASTHGARSRGASGRVDQHRGSRQLYPAFTALSPPASRAVTAALMCSASMAAAASNSSAFTTQAAPAHSGGRCAATWDRTQVGHWRRPSRDRPRVDDLWPPQSVRLWPTRSPRRDHPGNGAVSTATVVDTAPPCTLDKPEHIRP
jgi:hypothetical protein